MKPVDVVVILIISLIVFGASYYIYRAKKSGKKCIGCPSSSSCGGNCSSCKCNCNRNK